ncbi:MAG: DNA mismatch repair protein MutS [Saprospiraceae bacterium]|nr:DNA mismatch repair protein MutS [Saprospiraceae bacterium]
MARPPKSGSKPHPKNGEDNVTPLMRQYYSSKAKYPEAILLFRVGDFYETFGEDAVKTSQALGIVLTSRNNGGSDVELAGFPHHSLDNYLPKLVRAGYRVAICEQLEKPVAGRVVRRGVTEVITPGVTSDDKLLEQGRNNYLAALAIQKNEIGIAFLDISTGEFLVTEGDWAYVEKVFQTFQPAEVLFQKGQTKDFQERFNDKYYTFALEEWVFQQDYGREKLLQHFGTQTLKGFGIEDMKLAQMAAGAALHYLAATENTNLKHINHISRLLPDKYVWLDRFTIRNLELIAPTHESGRSLLDVLDKTLSPMGARLMKKWVVLPLKAAHLIEQRLDSVDYFIQNPHFKSETETLIRQIGDLERLISKVPLGKINPREVKQLARSLATIEPMALILRGANPYLKKLADGLNPCKSIRDEIEKTLVAEPPVSIQKGGAIADGAHAELDELRHIIRNAQQLLIDIQTREVEKTGITSLKIGFNSVFGYYLEVTAKYKHISIPENWIRKQTLANAERYITPELKVLEEKILTAEEKIATIEDMLFQRLVGTILDFVQPIQHNANVIAIVDCLRSFAEVATRNNYAKPQFTEGVLGGSQQLANDGEVSNFSVVKNPSSVVKNPLLIHITEGRHPVIEQQLPIGESYVPNDVYLDPDDQQILMITGPNMAGKSALLRQTALICLMAQMGSYVPAKAAQLGILDKVFTRVGASDNISSGESTFMVEMNETASIMNNISERSLILLDEIGRGTSTYDGISIAWSIAEYLHESDMRPKTLFATHYHELNELSEKFNRIKNYHVATKEIGQKVIFLRKLTQGGSEHSFGVHVARMAGMPRSIVERANEILAQLEESRESLVEPHSDKPADQSTPPAQEALLTHVESKKTMKNKLQNVAQPMQLNFFDIGDPRLDKIKKALDEMDLNSITPVELMMRVYEWKKMLDKP